MDDRNLDSLYKFYLRDVYRYLLSLCHDPYLAEDLVQETFFRSYLHIEDFREDKVKPWLFRVAHNVFIDHSRKEKRNLIKEETFFSLLPDHVSTEQQAMINQEILEVEQWTARLPEKQRYAILLADFHDLSYRESASVMGVSLGHLKILLYRARQTLRLKRERSDRHE